LSDGNGSFLLYDPATKVSFFTGGSHLTEAGLQKIRPVYERIAKQLAG
uniref:Inositol monophosphatase n=1 Tax=Heligmosomoides polygyrus TaxID=6339 RepID=A0A183GQ39_HELPZ